MNVKTRGEKINEAIEAIISTVRTAVEIAVILAGIVAIGLVGYMSHEITVLENQIEEMKMEQNQKEEDDRLVIRDAVTGRIIYDENR